MKITERFLMQSLAVCLIAVFLIFCNSCSSKSDNDNRERPELSAKDSGDSPKVREDKKTPVPENKPLERTLVRESEKRSRPVTIPHDDSSTERSEPDKNKIKVDAVMAEFNASDSPEKKKELIESLGSLSSGQDPYLINFVRNALDDVDPEVGQAAIELLEDYRTPEILPLIAYALETVGEETRAEAVALLANVNDPQVSDLINIALNDNSEDVREAASEVVEELSGSVMLDVMAKGIVSPYNDVKYEILSMLEDRGDHTSVDLIIEGLRDNDMEFCKEVNETMEFLIDRKFETYEDARFWWKENKHRYDEELFTIEDDG